MVIVNLLVKETIKKEDDFQKNGGGGFRVSHFCDLVIFAQ